MEQFALKKNFSDKTILICTVCVALSFLAQIFQVNAVVNLIYVFSLFVVIWGYFGNGYVNPVMIWLIVVSAFCIVMRGMVTNDMDYFSHYIINITTFMCIEMGVEVEVEEKNAKRMAYIFLATGAILVASYYAGPLKTSYFEGTEAVALNMHNPNAAALWLVCIFAILYYCAFIFNGIKRYISLGLAILIVPIILATESRNSYYACLLLLVFLPLTKLLKIRKVPKWVMLIIAMLPIIVFFFYMYVMVDNMEFWEGIFGGGSIDKSLGTRKSVWTIVQRELQDDFLIGNYPNRYADQMHNSLMTIYCRYGAIVTALAVTVTYRALIRLQETASFSGALSLAAILFTGCFEGSLFIGIAGLYLMLLVIPAIAGVESIKEHEKIERIYAWRSSLGSKSRM